MEVPSGAVLRDGWWHYKPAAYALEKLTLTRSTYAGDYQLCWASACRTSRRCSDRRRERV